MIDVSVIIVNYNSGRLLEECLASLYAHTAGIKFQVNVFDNGSSDLCLRNMATLYPQAKFVRGKENIGFARANNEAISSSVPARFYLLLNPDVLLRSNAVKTILDFMDRRVDIGICGPKILLKNGKLDAPCRRSFKTPAIYFYHVLGLSRLFPKSKRFGRYYLTYLDEDQECEVDSVIGAFLMIRRETIREIGLLDKQFYIYGEDEDWCWRAKQAGWKVYYNPQAAVVHIKGASTKKRRLPMVYQWHKAAYLFHRKNLADSYNFLINLLVYLGIACHLGITMFFKYFKLGRKESNET